MKIDYWLLETQEDIDNFEMSLDIASPTDMAKAIKRVRELHKLCDCRTDTEFDVAHCEGCNSDEYPCPTIKALDGEQ